MVTCNSILGRSEPRTQTPEKSTAQRRFVDNSAADVRKKVTPSDSGNVRASRRSRPAITTAPVPMTK
jgi:hypothetical protein